MNLRTCTTFVAAIAAAALAIPSIAMAQQDASKKPTPAATPQMTPQEQAAMAEMAQLGTPGEMHKLLAGMEGDWAVEAKMYMSPGTPPMESKGTAVKKLVYDGRYLTEEFNGDMMGTPFQGRATTGYDNSKKKYVGTWMDSMSTAIMFSEGTYDPATKTLAMSTSMYDPMHKKVMPARLVTRIVDPTTHVFEYWGAGPDGKEMKMMEITYKKK